MLCSWSGEEYGLLGSTAWGELNAAQPLLQRALAYLNVDVGVSGDQFQASGTPTLGQVLAGALGQVNDPKRGVPLSELWDDGDLMALGSGSDYTVFIDHLGIPSLDMSFSPGSAYGVYHSTFDSFEWMESEGDPGFLYHQAMARVWGLVALRLAGHEADAPAVVPLNYTLQAEAIKGYISDARARPNASAHLDFSKLDAAHSLFATAAARAMVEVAALAKEPSSPSRSARVAALNDRFAAVERRFLMAEGLPGRKWFRHCLQAPGLYTGYAPKTLPGVYDATTTEDWDVAQAQADRAAQHIAAAASALNEPVAHAVAMDDM